MRFASRIGDRQAMCTFHLVTLAVTEKDIQFLNADLKSVNC